MFQRILALALLMGISLSCVNSGSSKDSSEQSNSGTQGIAGVITGDIVAGVRIDLEKPDGTPVMVVTTGSDGSYIFPGAQLAETAYVVIPSKDNTQFVPPKKSINFVRSGVNRVDFGGLFAFPENVSTRYISLKRTPLDIVSTVGGNQLYVSLHPLDKTTDENIDPGSRVSIIRSYPPIQEGTANFDYKTNENMAIRLLVSADGKYLYALNINNKTAIHNVTSYELDKSDGLGKATVFNLDSGDVPSDMAISPDGKKIYVACETTNKVVVISALTMTFGNKITVISPISVAASKDYLFVVSRPIANGIATYTDLNRYYSSFFEAAGNYTINGFKAKKITMGLNEQKFYLMSEKNSDNGGTILEFGIDVNRLKEVPFGANNIPTNMIITPNNKDMYVTLDTLSADGQVAIIDIETFTRKKTISGLGRRPIGMGISVDTSPMFVLGMVLNEGDSSISIMK